MDPRRPQDGARERRAVPAKGGGDGDPRRARHGPRAIALAGAAIATAVNLHGAVPRFEARSKSVHFGKNACGKTSISIKL